MADGTYEPKVYKKSGGDVLVVASGGEQQVESGGEINIIAGGKITDDGTQAAHIATVTATGTFSTAICGKINSLILAVRGVGILATS